MSYVDFMKTYLLYSKKEINDLVTKSSTFLRVNN